jgi:hypothetical protein
VRRPALELSGQWVDVPITFTFEKFGPHLTQKLQHPEDERTEPIRALLPLDRLGLRLVALCDPHLEVVALGVGFHLANCRWLVALGGGSLQIGRTWCCWWPRCRMASFAAPTASVSMMPSRQAWPRVRSCSRPASSGIAAT